MSQNIIFFGATGIIGQFIIQALVNSKASFTKIAAATAPESYERKKDAFQKLEAQGVEIVKVSLDDQANLLDTFKNYDTVVSALGRGVIDKQIPLIKAAEESGTVKRFFPSEYGTDIEYWPKSASEKPHQHKLKVRKYIKDNVKRLEYTYLVTGPYAEFYVGPARVFEKGGGFNVKEKKAFLPGDGNGKVSLTTMPDVGKLLVASIKHPAESRNRALIVNSFTTTPNEIVAEFEKQTGSSWEKEYVPLEELRRVEQNAYEVGHPAAVGVTLRRIWAEGATLYDQRDNNLVGFKDGEAGTLQDIVEESIQRAEA